MKIRIAVVVLFLASMLSAVPMLFAADADVSKGLQNLVTIHRLAALAEMSVMGGVVPPNIPADPWGTPYRFEVTPNGYRIAGAGSDRKFDETNWATRAQFRDLEGDVVFENGKVMRTNRTWLYEQVNDVTRPDLTTLRDAEMFLMMSRTPVIRGLMGRRATESTIEALAAHLAAGGEAPGTTRDGWNTPLRVENAGGKVRIVSAGADQQFDEASWANPPKPSIDEDIVYENGRFTRRLEEQQILGDAAMPTTEPIVQPADAPHFTGAEAATAQRVGGDVKAPVVVTRVDPEYGESYRRARISGIVILETIISETGEVRDARVIKSLGPDLDMAAVKAVRQWKFQPGTMDGKPVPVIFNLTINFKLE